MNISIGTDSITGREFFIDSTKHLNIEGMSGMGKSTLIVNLFIEHIRQGKVGKLLRPSIIPIIGQTKSLDFLDIMNSKKVVCRFSKGRLGEEIAQILGSLVVSTVSISGLPNLPAASSTTK